MKIFDPYKTVTKVSFVLLVIASCNTQHSQLIDNFISYMSVVTVQRLLSPIQLTELEMSTLKGDEQLPVEQQYSSTMLVKTYQSLGVTGQLKLSFSYNRLWITCFTTSEINRYIRLLEEHQHLFLKLEPRLDEWSGRTSVSTIVSRRPMSHEICWYDVRLLEEEYYQNEP